MELTTIQSFLAQSSCSCFVCSRADLFGYQDVNAVKAEDGWHGRSGERAINVRAYYVLG